MKKALFKLISCVLTIMLLVFPLSANAVTVASKYSSNDISEEKIYSLLENAVDTQNQIPECIVPKNSSITSFTCRFVNDVLQNQKSSPLVI